MAKHRYNAVDSLVAIGISHDDAIILRRISMTLHRWHELECGDSNDYGSWAIVRGHKAKDGFTHNDDGQPFLEHHHYQHGRGKDYVTHSALPDRERGARKRLASVMARYPGFMAYIQGDPRGASLYILRPGDVPEGASIDSCYSRGIVVCQ